MSLVSLQAGGAWFNDCQVRLRVLANWVVGMRAVCQALDLGLGFYVGDDGGRGGVTPVTMHSIL